MITFPVRSVDDASQDLQQRVALFLQQHRLAANSRLSIEASRGVLTLAGQVPTFHDRQRIYAATRRVAGVVQVIDRLEVAGPLTLA
jgi:osmotically-inducible protein OsmY